MQQRVLFIILGSVLLLGVFGFALWHYVSPAPIPSSSPTASVTSSVPVPTVSPTPSNPMVTAIPQPTPYPASLTLTVPFSSQAPNGNWDAIHEDLCEEASLLMAEWYALGKSGSAINGYKNEIAPATAEQELLAMYNWESQHLNGSGSITAEETARVARESLGLKDVTVVSQSISEDSIKRYLASGKVVVVPAAGQDLHNPYYTAPGPPYHMLLVIGYNKQGFITNDPGTRHGEGYVYSVQTLMNAIHDWTGANATIGSGTPKILVIGKNS